MEIKSTADSSSAITHTRVAGRNVITFNRPGLANTNFPGEAEIVYKARVSADPGFVSGVAEILEGTGGFVVTNPGAATETVTITDTAATGSETVRFIRLFVSKP